MVASTIASPTMAEAEKGDVEGERVATPEADLAFVSRKRKRKQSCHPLQLVHEEVASIAWKLYQSGLMFARGILSPLSGSV